MGGEFVISVILWYHVCVVFVEVWRMRTDGSSVEGCVSCSGYLTWKLKGCIIWSSVVSCHSGTQRRYLNWCRSRKPSYGSFEELSHTNNKVKLASASVTRIHMHFVAAYFENRRWTSFTPWVGCCECIAAIPRNILLIILINFNLFQLSTPKLKIFLCFIPQLPTYTAPSQKGTKREEQDIQNYYLIFGERWGGRQNQILRAMKQCTRRFGSNLYLVSSSH